jgi:MFS family permease
MNSIMAIGSVAGALLSAGRGKPRLRVIFGAAAAFGVTSGLAALAPNYFWYGVALVPVGLFAITMMTSANGYVQTTTDPVMRGRVMALYMAIFMGGTPIGAPFVGWVANIAGPRWSMAVAAVAGLLAALIGRVWIIRAKQLRLHFNRRARGMRYFRLEPGTGATGSRQGGQHGDQRGDLLGAQGAQPGDLLGAQGSQPGDLLGAQGAQPGVRPDGPAGNDDGAAAAPGRDDAVGRRGSTS